jgi:hypothetical protein
LSGGAVVAVAAGIVLAFFLSLWPLHHLRAPVGWDSVDYVWRTRLAQRGGISHIADLVPPGMFVKSARPAFPAVAATLSSLGGVRLLLLAVVFPAVMAAAIGLAAGPLVRTGGALPWWSAPVATVVVGTSINSVLMVQYGYYDNLMIAAVFLAAAVAAVLSVEHRGAVIPAILLLGSAGLVHGALFTLTLAVMMATILAVLPDSWRRWRDGTRAMHTPAGRLAQVLAGAAVVAAATVYATQSGRPEPRLNRGEVEKKLREDLPRYGYWWMIPGALSSALLLGWGVRRRPGQVQPPERRRTLLTFLVAWVGVTFGGYAVYRLSDLPLPANRFLLFGLALPLLVAVGLGWMIPRLGGPAVVRAVAATAAVAAVLAFSFVAWLRPPAPGVRSWVDPAKLHDAKVVEAYLGATRIPPSRPVVFVTDDRGPTPGASVSLMRDHVFAILSTDRLAHVYVFMGDPVDFLAGRPSSLPGHASYSGQSARYFRLLQPALDEDPIAVISASFNQTYAPGWIAAHPDSVIPGTAVSVVQGPPPPAVFPPVPQALRQPSFVQLALLSAFALGSLALIGLGWSVALLQRWLAPQEILAVSPAVGIAALTVGAALADRAGVRLMGLPGALVPIVLAILGWATTFVIGRGSRGEQARQRA